MVRGQVRPRPTLVLCVGFLLVCEVLESEKYLVGSVLKSLLDDQVAYRSHGPDPCARQESE